MMTPYSFSTFSRRSWKHVTRRLCSGFSCSVVFSPWMRIPSASRGICRATPPPLLSERGHRASPGSGGGSPAGR